MVLKQVNLSRGHPEVLDINRDRRRRNCSSGLNFNIFCCSNLDRLTVIFLTCITCTLFGTTSVMKVIVVFQDLGLYSEDEADLENIDVHELAKILQVSYWIEKS